MQRDDAELECPALLIGGMASGQGKTTITAGLARYYSRAGYRVRVFKTGPDYLDPQILEVASGQPVEPLDLWMGGEDYCAHALHEAARDSDVILVEGAMGLFDGEPSSGDFAIRFGLPVAFVFDCKGMAQTAAAFATGLARWRPELQCAGLVANRLGSERHAALIADALPADIPMLASVARDPALALPERHLGLVQPGEQEGLTDRLDAAADVLSATALVDAPRAVRFGARAAAVPPRLLPGRRIAVARDEAFSFVYAANERLLTAMGAELMPFSPLRDEALPEADAVWLPGGYPELHAEQLAANDAMKAALRAYHAAGRPMLAECGGMLYLQETLTDVDGRTHAMAGVLPGHGVMRTRGGCQGMQTAPFPEGDVRAHAHHRSRSEGTLEPIAHGHRQRHPAPGEAVVRAGRLTATYMHLFFPSNPEAVAALLSPASAVSVQTAAAGGAPVAANT